MPETTPTVADRSDLSDGADWIPVSPLLVNAKRRTALIVCPLPILGGCLLGVLVSPWWLLLAAPFAYALVTGLWLSPRRVAAIGYRERADDLSVRSAVLTRTVTLVPYGRLQSVELEQGPINTRYGLAQVEVHTAGSTSITVPGLPLAEAEGLRDRLATRVQTRDSGL